MTEIIERSGLILATGGLKPEHNPASRKYDFAATFGPPRSANLSETRILSDWNGRDLRSPIKYQGRIGACAAFATTSAAEICARASGRPETFATHPGILYREAREIYTAQGWHESDTGSYVSDNADIAMVKPDDPLRQGLCLASATPYREDVRYHYPERAGAYRADYVSGHSAIYPADGLSAVLSWIWLALDNGDAVVASSYWPGPWFNLQRGIVPAGIPFSPTDGGHAYVITGITPLQGGYLLPDNSWSAGWTPDAHESGLPGMRPGSFAIPWSYIPTGMIWEFRVIRREPFAPAPEPEPPRPQPNPEPEPEPLPETVRRRDVERIVTETQSTYALLDPRSTRRRYGLESLNVLAGKVARL